MKKQIIEKLKEMLLKMLSLSFLTWVIGTLIAIKKLIPATFTEWMLFTCSIIGIKVYKELNE